MAKLFIGPYKTGLERDLEPWLLPEEAFPTLEDAYVWRSRVRKKPGVSILGRLHLTPTLPEAKANVATGAVTYAAVITNTPVSPGTVTIVIGTPAPMTFTDNGNGTLTSATVVGNFGVINYESGAFTLTFNPALPGGGPFAVNVTAYRHLPRLSAMGLSLYENTIVNREDLIAFDEDYSYLYNTGTGIFDVLPDGAGNDQVWSGSNSDFFWSANYYQDTGSNYLFWTTNNVANSIVAGQTRDGIQIYDGTNWSAQTPLTQAAVELRGCLILIPYRNRMVALNTLEGAATPAAAVRFPNRARWSQNGVPYTTTIAGFDVNAWREDIIGRGGFIDCPTRQAIVSAEFVKDTLIVFFERSTWELRYTGNELLPFVWFQVNSELGAESTFSSVGFDKGIFAVGDKGIIISDALNVERIDKKIPDEVYNFHNDNTGPARVHGIRDHFLKMVYWCFPNDDPNEIFPDKVLALNYDEGSYAIFNDSFTCFGTWQDATDYTWATLPFASWTSWDLPWGSPVAQSYFPNIIAGNQKGFVLTLNQGIENSPSMDLADTLVVPAITNASPAVCSVVNHNLKTGQFVKLSNIRGFAVNVVAEALGTAAIGEIGFTATLANNGLIPGILTVTDGLNNFVDLGDGTLSPAAGITGTIEYETGTVRLTFPAPLGAALNITATYSYNILNNEVFYVQRVSANTFSIFTIDATTDGTVPVDLSAFGAPYNGAGQVAVINNINILTKRFSPFIQEDQEVRMPYVDVFLSTNDGSFLTNVYGDQDSTAPINQLTVSSQDNNGRLSDKNWKRIFTNVDSSFIQLQFRLSNFQMTQQINYASDFVLHALSLEVQGTGRL
jgi:hypothetical protein